jgi:hypothetical protein
LRWKFQIDGLVGAYPPFAGITIDYNGKCYFKWARGGIISLIYAGSLQWKLDWTPGQNPRGCERTGLQKTGFGI